MHCSAIVNTRTPIPKIQSGRVYANRHGEGEYYFLACTYGFEGKILLVSLRTGEVYENYQESNLVDVTDQIEVRNKK